MQNPSPVQFYPKAPATAAPQSDPDPIVGGRVELQLLTTLKCNLKCSYCSLGVGEVLGSQVHVEYDIEQLAAFWSALPAAPTPSAANDLPTQMQLPAGFPSTTAPRPRQASSISISRLACASARRAGMFSGLPHMWVATIAFVCGPIRRSRSAMSSMKLSLEMSANTGVTPAFISAIAVAAQVST